MNLEVKDIHAIFALYLLTVWSLESNVTVLGIVSSPIICIRLDENISKGPFGGKDLKYDLHLFIVKCLLHLYVSAGVLFLMSFVLSLLLNFPYNKMSPTPNKLFSVYYLEIFWFCKKKKKKH